MTTSNISLAWQNLRLEVDHWNRGGLLTRKKKVILDGLCGYLERGTVTGLMGPSGAGKTSLMKCLNGVVRPSKDSKIYLNSSITSMQTIFVAQHVEQTVFADLTVGELLYYAYRFQHGSSASQTTIDAVIKRILAELLLDPSVFDRRFGHCSGGEQKRVAVGQQLTGVLGVDKFEKSQYNNHSSSLLVLVDEPTTGLDSLCAQQVVQVLRHLAVKHHLTILASIHVPNQATLGQFHRLMVVARGGRCIYTGTPNDLKPFLELHLNTEIPPDHKPIEHAIVIACEGSESAHVQTLSAITTDQNTAILDSNLSQLTALPITGLSRTRKRFNLTDLRYATARQLRLTFAAQRRLFLLKHGATVLTLLFVATFYHARNVLPSGCDLREGQPRHDPNNTDFLRVIYNLVYLSIAGLLLGYATVMFTIIHLNATAGVLRNEHRNQWYSLGAGYLSTVIVSTLQTAITAVLGVTVVYFALSEHAIDSYRLNPTRFGHYLLVTFLFLAYIQSIGTIIGQLTTRLELCLLCGLFTYTVMSGLNDWFFDTEAIRVRLWAETANLVGLKYVHRALVYVFYGLDRGCDYTQADGNTPYSTLAVHHVRPEFFGFYMRRIVENMLVVQCITFGFMYVKLNSGLPTRFRWIRFSSLGIGANKRDPRSVDACVVNIGVGDKNKRNNNYNHSNNNDNNNDQAEKKHTEKCNFLANKVAIAWRRLTLHRPGMRTGQQQPPILCNLNGAVHFGSLTAIMGVSGAGKTSLLKLLNGQNHQNLSEASGFYVSRFVPLRTCFITQAVADHLFPQLTALQNLVYASRLKNVEYQQQNNLGPSLDHTQIAMNLLSEFQLLDTVHTPVDRCSGGEQKRLALALELTALRMPNLVCFDEPLSGLDSNSALTVITCLKRLVQSHPIALVTIVHQPTVEIAATFDHIYMLARGGVCIYSGSLGSISDTLSELGIPPGESNRFTAFPLDTLVEKSCQTPGDDPVVRQLMDQTEKKLNSPLFASELLRDTQLVDAADSLLTHQHRIRFSTAAVWILLDRSVHHFIRYQWKEYALLCGLITVYVYFVRIFFDPAIADADACVSLDEDTGSREWMFRLQLTVYTNFKCIMFLYPEYVVILTVYLGFKLYREMALLRNETRNGWYNPGCFYAHKVAADLLPLLPLTLLYVYCTNIYERAVPGIYPHLALLALLTLACYQAFTYAIVLLVGRRPVAIGIGQIAQLLVLLHLSNLLTQLSSVNPLHRTLANLSALRWTVDALFLLQYGFGRCRGPRRISTVMQWIGLQDGDYGWCLAGLGGCLVAYHLVAIWLLNRWINHNNKGNNGPAYRSQRNLLLSSTAPQAIGQTSNVKQSTTTTSSESASLSSAVVVHKIAVMNRFF